MHDLALCMVHADGHAPVDGFVRALEADVLTVGTSHVVLSLTPGDDVTVRVLDEVRGECVYAGFVSRVVADELDVADLELVSTLQKREVARVRIAVASRGRVVRPGPAPGPGASSTEIAFTVLDVSAHGMQILARVAVAVGSVVRFRFEELDAPFPIDAVVVRSVPSRTGTHYGCRFTGLTARQMDALFGYVLRTQGAQRRERLGV